MTAEHEAGHEPELPADDGVVHDDGWVAWGHGSTKTRVRGSGSHSASRRRSTSSRKHHHHHRHHHRHRRRRGRVTRRVLAVVCAVLVVALLACGGAFAYTAHAALQHAEALMEQVDALQEDMAQGDAQAMQSAASSIAEHASGLHSAVDNPLWAAASVLPGVGTDVTNARVLASAVDDLAANAITPLAGQADTFDLGSVLTSEHGVDVEALAALAEVIEDVAPAVQRSVDAIDGLEQGSIEQVNVIIESAEEQLSSLNALCSGLSELAPYLQDMLGADEQRTYLIVAHNTSELKSSGGFIGSVGTLTVDDGSLELGEFGTFNEANRDSEYTGDMSKRLAVSDEEDELFTWTYGLHSGDSGVNPDFSREGELCKEFWESIRDDDIDGVIALDSHVLASFLAYVGSVITQDGLTVSADNCVQMLNCDIYWEYFSGDDISDEAAADTDELFAEIAELAFDKAVSNIGSVGIFNLADILAQSAGDNRLMVWMADEDEELAMEQLDVAGTINSDATVPEIGVFLESRNASKLGWWTRADTSYDIVARNNDGSVTYEVTTTVSNTITEEEVEQADEYITGTSDGTVGYTLYLYAPAGGTIESVSALSEADVEYHSIEGNEVAKLVMHLDPEGSDTVSYLVTTSAEAQEGLSVRSTPLAYDDE